MAGHNKYIFVCLSCEAPYFIFVNKRSVLCLSHLGSDSSFVSLCAVVCVGALMSLSDCVQRVDGIMRALCAMLCLGLVVALQSNQQVHKVHSGILGHQWMTENCRRLSNLLRHKQSAVRKLSAAGVALERDKKLAPPEKLFRIHTLEVFQRELNESERSLFQAVEGLQRVLKGNLRDVVNMKDSSRQRLQALREAAIKVSCVMSYPAGITPTAKSSLFLGKPDLCILICL